MKISKPRRGRPREFDRDAALVTALDLFWRCGFEGTSIETLTNAIGISAPSLYSAFGSKEALYRETVERYLATYGQVFWKAFSEEPRTREAVAKLLQDAARQFSNPGHPAGCLVSYGILQCSEHDRGLAAEMSAHRSMARELVKTRLDAAQTAGEVSPDTDTTALATFFSAVVQGMAVQARDGESYEALANIAVLAMKAWPTDERE